MKKIAVLFLCVFIIEATHAVSFSELSRETPVMVGFSADKTSNVSFQLTLKSLKENRLNIFLNVQYIIGKDTLNDYLYLDESYEGTIKEIYLNKGDSVFAFIFLNNEETNMIKNLKGSFETQTEPGLDMSSTGEMSKFTGTVWKSDQLPLFRIAKSDEKSQMLNIDVSLTENFEFDKLYMKIKVVSPAQGILLYTKELTVNKTPELPYKRKVIKIDFPDLEMKKPGSYYVQVFHEMKNSRINGVEYISYRLTDK